MARVGSVKHKTQHHRPRIQREEDRRRTAGLRRPCRAHQWPARQLLCVHCAGSCGWGVVADAMRPD